MVSRLLSSAFTSAPLLLSLATLGWAGNTIAGRLAVGEVSPLVIVFMRWTIVFAILLMTKRKELPAALPKLKGKGIYDGRLRSLVFQHAFLYRCTIDNSD